MASVNELLRDAAISHAVDLQHYSNGVIRRIIGLLNRADADLFAQLTEALDRLPAESFTVDRLERLLKSVRELNAEAYRSVEKELSKELRDFAAYEAGYQLKLFEATIPAQVQVAVGVAAVNPTQVYTAAMARPFQGRLLKEWAGSIEAGRMTRIRDAIRMGYVEGQTTDQIIRRLRGTRAKGYADGIIEIDRRHAAAVVQTALGHMANFARERVYDENKGLIKAVEWVSAIDTKTSDQCRIRDKKRYTPEDHKPIGHSIPWGAGPGQLHWNAVPAGSLICTDRGMIAIENVRVGDRVLSHSGSFKPVLDVRRKQNESGVLRVVHLESGRILRATYDHPVLTRRGWRFIGALEVGDELFCDLECPIEVPKVACEVVSEPDNRPPISDEGYVALQRAAGLMPAIIDFECDPQGWYGEIENKVLEAVLRNPAVIEDKSFLHHLLALTHTFEQLGRKGLGNFLALLYGNLAAFEKLRHASVEPIGLFGASGLCCDLRNLRGVVLTHDARMVGVLRAALFGQPVSPMLATTGGYAGAGGEISADLLSLASNGQADAKRVSRKSSVCESFRSLNISERPSFLDMLNEYELAMVGERFGHDVIHSLELSHYNSDVFDLEIQEDSSYVCNGIVVSNCRSTSVPITKSWRELGIDIDEIEPSTRASMDGQIPAETTYADWLQRQSAARQDQVLGPTRGKLMREGGLTMDRFYNEKGKFLSLDELRQRDAAAFERAGLD